MTLFFTSASNAKMTLSTLFTCFLSSVIFFDNVFGFDPRILNGFEEGENKYTAAVTRDGQFMCGGSIIGRRHILTAAHCMIDEHDHFRNGEFKVVIGSTDLTIDQPSRIDVEVEAMYAPKFYNGTMWQVDFPEGDIAVLKLRRSLDLSRKSGLEKLRLPKVSRSRNESYLNQMAVVTGYGLDKVETAIQDGHVKVMNASTSLKLYKARSIVLDHVECSNHYETMYKSNLCGKVVNHRDNTPQGVCEGDSGGPLVYDGNVVIGVVSGSAPACNENEYPSVFTKVASFLKFIRNVKRGRMRGMRVSIGRSEKFF